jgi:hypothetical protein
MSRISNRRGFFRLLFEETGRGAREVAPMMPLPMAAAARGLSGQMPDVGRPEPIVAVPPSERCLTPEELRELAEEYRLTKRLADLEALAVSSIRLTPGHDGHTGGSYLVAYGAAPRSVQPPAWRGRALRVAVELDLTEVPATHWPCLPREGRLMLLVTGPDQPSGHSTDAAGACAVVHLDRTASDQLVRQRRTRGPVGAQQVRLSAELSLPRPWSRPVERLGLSILEQDGWQQLRREIAQRQGVELVDEASAADGMRCVHRLLGYPDERIGKMRLVCEAAARGIDLDGGDPHEHPRAHELEDGADRWRLLFQLTADPSLGWIWANRRERLYVWVPDEDLRECRFDNTWAIAQ